MLIALGWAWLFWWINALSGIGAGNFVGMLLIALGGISPTMAALFLLFRHEGPAVRRDFFRRIYDLRLIRAPMLAFTLLLPPALLLVAVLLTRLGDDASQPLAIDPYYVARPLALLPFALFIMILGPLPEEIGWRGYLLDALNRKTNALIASLLIGLVWGLWHVPLFFIDGYPLAEMTASTPALIIYFGLLLPKSVVYTWLFFKTNRSIASAILFHFMINLVGSLVDTSLRCEALQLLLWTIIAGLLIMISPAVFRKG